MENYYGYTKNYEVANSHTTTEGTTSKGKTPRGCPNNTRKHIRPQILVTRETEVRPIQCRLEYLLGHECKIL